MNGHRKYLDLMLNCRHVSYQGTAKGHRSYTNPTPFKRVSVTGAKP
jgi:hypothetical protein